MTATHPRPLRLLQVVQRFFPELGGTETHVAEVTRRLALRDDMDVTVFATDRSGTLPRRDEVEGVRVLRRRSWPRERDFYVCPGLWPVVNGGDWDIVHFQGVHTFVPIIGMAAAKRSGVPYTLTFHSGGHSAPSRARVRGAQWKALAPLLRGADRLIAVSRFERSAFAASTGIDAARFSVIPNGGALPPVPAGTEPVPGRIVSSGRLERYKGHHRAIEALPLVQREVPGAHLVILGGGAYEPELRALAARLGVADDVTIRQLPPADRAAMASALASAGVMAALSSYEAHPVAVMEAVAIGLPVVGCDIAGIGDLVEDGLVTGVPHEAGPEVVAAALVTELRASAGQVGPRPLPETALPTWDTCAEQVAEVYLDIARSRGLR